jgi:hypothetical protein
VQSDDVQIPKRNEFLTDDGVRLSAVHGDQKLVSDLEWISLKCSNGRGFMKYIKAVTVSLTLAVVPLSNAFSQSWVCEYADLKRYVDIDYPNSPSSIPCSVIYRKPTENVDDRILWRAQNDEGYCENRARALVEKLESLGWRCSRNEVTSARKSLSSEPTSRSTSATALEKKFYDAVKLDNVANASSIRFDEYLDVLEDFREDKLIGDGPNGQISEYHAYYLLDDPLQFMGHKIVVLTEPTADEDRNGCCPDRNFKVYLETVGDTQPLKEFAESNNCYFQDKYIWPFGGMHFQSGQYVVLDCQTD